MQTERCHFSMDLRDRFTRENGTVFLTGIQALVRLILDKQRADAAIGHVNQSFITGYEGSPLGGFDIAIAQQIDLLNQLGRTVHQPGVNEKAAASAILGSQYADTADVDAFWYGKAHGAMWVPDEVWLANLAGSAGSGALVLLCGEDHNSKSSVTPGNSDWVLRSSYVPIFYPSSVAEILTLGMHAIALSRQTGLVTALKLTTPICDGAATIALEGGRSWPRQKVTYRKQFNPLVMATGALPMQRELLERKVPLAAEYVRLNQLNHIVDGDAGGDVGIVATGKSGVDLACALEAMDLQIPVLQINVTFPLDKNIVARFARDLRCVYVIEEAGDFVEDGIRAALWKTGVKEVYGKTDEHGAPLIPAYAELTPDVLIRALEPRLKGIPPGLSRRRTLDEIDSRTYPPVPTVSPMSCGGCPYNTFRDLSEKPGGAIGCSSIRAVEAYDSGVLYIPTMGAGGAIYSGWSQFNGNKHIFQYLGDGSYFHSGRGAIQSCVDAGTNITFLLLFNGAVALTGGQRPAGQRSTREVVSELLGMGVEKIGIVSEDPSAHKLEPDDRLELYSTAHHAEALNSFEGLPGTTALILDKECATERNRRARRTGTTPTEYIMINEAICEACGDCFKKSEGCAALYQVSTDAGPKTQVRTSQCTVDSLCVEGDCPAFVSMIPAAGTTLRRRARGLIEPPPEPVVPEPERSFSIYATGRGGTGVVTISHILAFAAMMEGKFVYLSNNTGLAQKGGPVEAPIQISSEKQIIFHHLLPGAADLYLGFDLIRAAEPGNLRYATANQSVGVVSTSVLPTAEQNRHPDGSMPDAEFLRGTIEQYTRSHENFYLDTYSASEILFADSIFANMILLGAAFQIGSVPVSSDSIEKAIRLNDRTVEHNLCAFRWGRISVADPERLIRLSEEEDLSPVTIRYGGVEYPSAATVTEAPPSPNGLGDEELAAEVGLYMTKLSTYQDASYASGYLRFVEDVRGKEQKTGTAATRFTRTVAYQLYRLMTYKDEYEVARLATRPEFERRIHGLFEGRSRIQYHLQPPTLRWLFKKKIRCGWGTRPVLRLLARMKWLRGSRCDPFRFTKSRRQERELVDWYRELITALTENLDASNYDRAVEIAAAADRIRGFETVKQKAAETVMESTARARQRFETG
jgi:indolepyruvate ferredoxin oxidoreductase